MTNRNAFFARSAERRGMAMILALVCLAAAAILLGVVARIGSQSRRAADDEGRRAQADWLVESGVDRALARLAADPDYQGETWRVGPEAFDGRRGAIVRIEVVADPQTPDARSVRVQADWPDDPIVRIRKTKQVEIPFNRLNEENKP